MSTLLRARLRQITRATATADAASSAGTRRRARDTLGSRSAAAGLPRDRALGCAVACDDGVGGVNGDRVRAHVEAAAVGRAALTGGGIVRDRDIEQVGRAAAVGGNSHAAPSRGGSPGLDSVATD